MGPKNSEYRQHKNQSFDKIPTQKMSAKDQSRDARLSVNFSHKADSVLRSKFNAEALVSCQSTTKAFGDCAKRTGLGVVFQCRQENRDMNLCLSTFNTEENFENYKQKRGQEIIKASKSLTYSAETNLSVLATAFVIENKITQGEGCNGAREKSWYSCPARFVLGMMEEEIRRVQALERGGATIEESGRATAARVKLGMMEVGVDGEARELEANAPSTISTSTSTTSSTSTFAPVPCIPPYCSFRCADIPEEAVCSEWASPTNPFDRVQPKFCKGVAVYPIIIGVPEGDVVDCVPRKTNNGGGGGGGFAPMKPNNYNGDNEARNNYMFGHNEEHEYKRSYRRSFYGRTTKKSGWDCLRHYEILASGSVPYFVGLEECPKDTLAWFPKELLLKVQQINGVSPTSIDFSSFDYPSYYCAASSLLNYTREHLTTKAVAEYVLNTVNRNNAQRVLFLSGHEGVDYVRDMLLHGLKGIVPVVVDYVKPPHLYDIDENVGPKEWTNENLYGHGFTMARRLREFDDDESYVERGDLARRIKDREFDLVVFGSVHRGMLFWDEVKENYGREEIVFVDGEDEHGLGGEGGCKKWKEYGELGYYFMREIPDDCGGLGN